ncbi:MAG: DUF1127 domain-containing protein [Alphaproteobacteria bacterium]|nr:DUF1127 domain-containing protein [Alphaproteobacteria bacterium]
MTQTLNSLVDGLSRLRARYFTPLERRNWSIGGARANPEVGNPARATNLLDGLIATVRNRNLRRKWRLELGALDDQQLQDIGVSRVEIERMVGRLRFWI